MRGELSGSFASGVLVVCVGFREVGPMIVLECCKSEMMMEWKDLRVDGATSLSSSD